MSVPNRQTAWDFLAKQAVLAVPNWYQTIEVGTKQYAKPAFRVGLPPKNDLVSGSKQMGGGTKLQNRVGLPCKSKPSWRYQPGTTRFVWDYLQE